MNKDFKPLKDGVLVRPCEPDSKTAGGIYIPESAKETPMHGEVVSVGVDVKELKVGDPVLFGQFTGTTVKLTDGKYLFMKEEEVYGIFN